MTERVKSSLRVEQNFSQLLHEAFVSLRTLGKRSVLALLGIVIGSSSVVALINIGHNAAVDAAMIFKDMGTDTLVAQFPPKGSSTGVSKKTTVFGRLTVPNDVLSAIIQLIH